jgi:hypothetical protein
VRRRKSIWAISLFYGEVKGEEMTAVSSGVAWMGSGIGSMIEIRNAEGVVVCAATVQRGIELRGGC